MGYCRITAQVPEAGNIPTHITDRPQLQRRSSHLLVRSLLCYAPAFISFAKEQAITLVWRNNSQLRRWLYPLRCYQPMIHVPIERNQRPIGHNVAALISQFTYLSWEVIDDSRARCHTTLLASQEDSEISHYIFRAAHRKLVTTKLFREDAPTNGSRHIYLKNVDSFNQSIACFLGEDGASVPLGKNFRG